jgi:hypothetical protein
MLLHVLHEYSSSPWSLQLPDQYSLGFVQIALEHVLQRSWLLLPVQMPVWHSLAPHTALEQRAHWKSAVM